MSTLFINLEYNVDSRFVIVSFTVLGRYLAASNLLSTKNQH